jgi:hypothetical protein
MLDLSRTGTSVKIRRMVSSGLLRRVAVVRTDVSEEPCASFITDSFHPGEGGASSSETSLLTRATRRNISEDTILHSYRRENLRCYKLRGL